MLVCKLSISLLTTLACVTLPMAFAAAQDSPDTETLRQQVEKFFENLENETVNANDAFQDLLADGPLADADAKQFDLLVDEYEQLEERYGKFLEAKLIDVKNIGEDVIFLTFFYKTERFPVVWRFVYYRPPTEAVEQPDWFVVRLSFDTKLEQLSTLP